MSTISGIIYNRKGTAGSNGSWKVEPLYGYYPDHVDHQIYRLSHYSVIMLVWRESESDGIEVLTMSLGHGTVSDQGGMNQAFKALGLPLYYSRKGGAEIVDSNRYSN